MHVKCHDEAVGQSRAYIVAFGQKDTDGQIKPVRLNPALFNQDGDDHKPETAELRLRSMTQILNLNTRPFGTFVTPDATDAADAAVRVELDTPDLQRVLVWKINIATVVGDGTGANGMLYIRTNGDEEWEEFAPARGDAQYEADAKGGKHRRS